MRFNFLDINYDWPQQIANHVLTYVDPDGVHGVSPISLCTNAKKQDFTNLENSTRNKKQSLYGCFLKWWYPQIIHFNWVFPL